MKIAVSVTIEINPAEWDGGGRTSVEVREDVKEYLRHAIPGLALMDEAGADVTLR